MDFGAAYSQKLSCHICLIGVYCNSVRVCWCVVYIISVCRVRAETHSLVGVQHPLGRVSCIPYHVERLSEFMV